MSDVKRCARCGADEFRVDGYCSCECRNMHGVEQERDAAVAQRDAAVALLRGVIESLDVIDQTMPEIARRMVHGAFVRTEQQIRAMLSSIAAITTEGEKL